MVDEVEGAYYKPRGKNLDDLMIIVYEGKDGEMVAQSIVGNMFKTLLDSELFGAMIRDGYRREEDYGVVGWPGRLVA